jgi:WD40 repeat protein
VTTRRSIAVAVVAALGAGAGFAGCKDKESLVIVTLTTAVGDPTLATATISVGTHSETFPLSGGVPVSGVSLGVYVPSSIKGPQVISVVASPAQAGDCDGETGSGDVDITSVGETYGPELILLSASTAACPGTGGTSGTGGTTGAGGTSGTGGTTGTGGRNPTGGTTGTGGSSGAAGSGATGGHAGATGTGGLGGQAGGAATGGTGGHAGAPGTGGMGGGSGTPKGISACFEYDHAANGSCAMSACSNDTAVYGAAFSPKNPNLAVTGGNDHRTKVWTVSSAGKMSGEGHVLTGTGNGVLGFSPDGTLLAIGGDGVVQIVSVTSWTVLRTLTVVGIVYGVDFSPDGTQVITLTADSTTTPASNHLYVHAATNPAALHSVNLTDGWALAVSPVSAGGAVLVSVTTTTGSALIYSLTAAGFSAPTTLAVTNDQSTAEMTQFSPNGALLAGGGHDGLLHFWSLPVNAATQPASVSVSTVTGNHSDWVTAVAFSPDSAELALGAGDFGSVTTIATASRVQVGVEQDPAADYDVTALGYSPDGKWFIGGEYDCGCVFICLH